MASSSSHEWNRSGWAKSWWSSKDDAKKEKQVWQTGEWGQQASPQSKWQLGRGPSDASSSEAIDTSWTDQAWKSSWKWETEPTWTVGEQTPTPRKGRTRPPKFVRDARKAELANILSELPPPPRWPKEDSETEKEKKDDESETGWEHVRLGVDFVNQLFPSIMLSIEEGEYKDWELKEVEFEQELWTSISESFNSVAKNSLGVAQMYGDAVASLKEKAKKVSVAPKCPYPPVGPPPVVLTTSGGDRGAVRHTRDEISDMIDNDRDVRITRYGHLLDASSQPSKRIRIE